MTRSSSESAGKLSHFVIVGKTFRCLGLIFARKVRVKHLEREWRCRNNTQLLPRISLLPHQGAGGKIQGQLVEEGTTKARVSRIPRTEEKRHLDQIGRLEAGRLGGGGKMARGKEKSAFGQVTDKSTLHQQRENARVRHWHCGGEDTLERGKWSRAGSEYHWHCSCAGARVCWAVKQPHPEPHRSTARPEGGGEQETEREQN